MAYFSSKVQPAMTDAKICGNRSDVATKISENHSNPRLSQPGFLPHCFARRASKNPYAMSASEAPISHGRYLSRKAPSPAAPAASHSVPSGRQQLDAASTLPMAASDEAMDRSRDNLIELYLLRNPQAYPIHVYPDALRHSAHSPCIKISWRVTRKPAGASFSSSEGQPWTSKTFPHVQQW